MQQKHIYKVLNAQHYWCEASTQYVRSINTYVKDKKQELLWSLLPIGKIDMSNLC